MMFLFCKLYKSIFFRIYWWRFLFHMIFTFPIFTLVYTQILYIHFRILLSSPKILFPIPLSYLNLLVKFSLRYFFLCRWTFTSRGLLTLTWEVCLKTEIVVFCISYPYISWTFITSIRLLSLKGTHSFLY